MDEEKKERLEASGWKVGDAADFLEMSPEEAAYVDLQIALGRSIRRARERDDLTQRELAEAIGSSQSRVAKMESGDPSVSLDLQIRALFALGLSREEVGEVISSDDEEGMPRRPVR
ncbi:MAG: helix-turn-helix transcriptional regulator [Persicimonas sp.]